MLINTPFEQFEIKQFYYYKDSLILSDLFIVMILLFSFYFSVTIINLSTKKQKINIFKKHVDTIYNFVFALITSYLGERYNNTYFPFLFYLFSFILLCNLSGLIPLTPTLTSHFFFNISLSSIVWIGVFIIGIQRKGIRFMEMFYPRQAAASLITLLGVIELMSWVFRVFSLALRLLANMIAGHVLLYCISFIIYNILSVSLNGFNLSLFSILFASLPMAAFVFLLFFEAGVALLQAYIFLVLSCIYLKEVL